MAPQMNVDLDITVGIIVSVGFCVFAVNGCMVASFVFVRQIRKATDALIMSLACADTVMGFALFINTMYSFFFPQHVELSVTVAFFCVMQLATFSSQISIMLIALDYLVSIFLPLRYTLIASSRVKLCAICIAWLCALRLAIKVYITSNAFNFKGLFTGFAAYVIVCVQLIAIYGRIGFTAFAQRRKIQATDSGEVPSRAMQTLGKILGSFLLFWFPHSIATSYFLYLYMNDDPRQTSHVLGLCLAYTHIFGYLNSVANAFIYAWATSAYKELLRKIFKTRNLWR
ncbi:hypothetical protein CAPTEDRAFT_202557 [Capitella teleta]|uniref:G-protein coupled receptors family 1 profile domain-containing protein n=1 Tax=Capitella teleta TaxID=283909 RepID=R7V3J9_CAPTE|nr:hypothetical protein CAPTEDRAFT_202557 [Capitella teleta]|eukprot:ELU13119.1 hypothetical protein CAPTEDRAFT_202557 [Capitella teleta]